MPTVVQPMLATLVDAPFSNDDWLFETKWDGVRTICFLKSGRYAIIFGLEDIKPPQFRAADEERAKERNFLFGFAVTH